MIQRRERLRFTLESRQPLGVVGKGFRQDLEATSRPSLVSVAR